MQVLIGMMFVGMFVAIAFGALAAIPVMLLWNWCVAGFLPVGELGYFQAWGIYVLCNLLFRSIAKVERSNKSG